MIAVLCGKTTTPTFAPWRIRWPGQRQKSLAPNKGSNNGVHHELVTNAACENQDVTVFNLAIRAELGSDVSPTILEYAQVLSDHRLHI